jgi:hypothetical protein
VLFRQKEQEITMNSIRRFAYIAALVLGALNLAPSMASAQAAAGTFTLTHEVRWQNAVVPAGKYHFTMGANGPSELLTLSKVSGNGATFMLLVNDTDASLPSEASRLVVVSTPGGRFVSSMQLPEFGLTLHFNVPTETPEVAPVVAINAPAAR